MPNTGRVLRTFLVAVGAIAVVLWLVMKAERRGTVVIGLAYPGYVEEVIRAAEARIAEWELEDLEIRLVFDTISEGDNPEDQVGRARRILAHENVVAIVGHASSRATLAAAPIYATAGIPVVAPTATSRSLGDAPGEIFTLIPNEIREGRLIADYVIDSLEAQSVVIYHSLDVYGTGLRDGIAVAMDRRGVQPVDVVALATDDFIGLQVEASIQRVPDPGVVVIADRDRQTALIMRAYESAGVYPRFVGGDGIQGHNVLRSMAPVLADSLVFLRFWDPDDSNRSAFLDYFLSERGSLPESSRVVEYEAVMLVASIIRDRGTDPSDIADELEKLAEYNSIDDGGAYYIRLPTLTPRLAGPGT